jgi:hypothetical protein
MNFKLLPLLLLSVLGAHAQSLKPAQIIDLYHAAHQTLDFAPVASHVHPQTLADYRKITTVILQHAVEKYGKTPVLAYFQGLNSLDELKTYSNADYWSYLMAASLQFSSEKPIQKSPPIGEIPEDANHLSLVYRVQSFLVTAPEIESLGSHVVYTFEKEKGSWKWANFAPRAFESSLYWFLKQQKGGNS